MAYHFQNFVGELIQSRYTQVDNLLKVFSRIRLKLFIKNLYWKVFQFIYDGVSEIGKWSSPMDFVRHVTKKCLQINEFPSLMKFMYSILEIYLILRPMTLGLVQNCSRRIALRILQYENQLDNFCTKEIAKFAWISFSPRVSRSIFWGKKYNFTCSFLNFFKRKWSSCLSGTPKVGFV